MRRILGEQGEVVRLAQNEESYRTFEERKAALKRPKTERGHNKEVQDSQKKALKSAGRSIVEETQPKIVFVPQPSLAIKVPVTSEVLKSDSQSEANSGRNIEDFQQLPAMVDRLNTLLKNRGHLKDDENKISVEDLKKINEMVDPALKGLDLSVNQELTAYLKRLEESIVTINHKVDIILSGQHSTAGKKDRRRGSGDDSLVLSAYRDSPPPDLRRPGNAACPVHGRLKNLPHGDRAAKSDLHDGQTQTSPRSPRKAEVRTEVKWLPVHANRYFLDPDHRVQKQKRHPLEWETLDQEKERLSKKRIEPLPVPELVKVKSSKSLLSQLSPGEPKKFQRVKTDTSSIGTKRKASTRFGEERSLAPSAANRMSQPAISWQSESQKHVAAQVKAAGNQQTGMATMSHSQSLGMMGLQKRRDLALMNRKKLELTEKPLTNQLPWHKKRVSPVR